MRRPRPLPQQGRSRPTAALGRVSPSRNITIKTRVQASDTGQIAGRETVRCLCQGQDDAYRFRQETPPPTVGQVVKIGAIASRSHSNAAVPCRAGSVVATTNTSRTPVKKAETAKMRDAPAVDVTGGGAFFLFYLLEEHRAGGDRRSWRNHESLKRRSSPRWRLDIKNGD